MKHLRQYVFIIFGAAVMAVGFNLFLIPNKIAAGGASGVATILNAKFGLNVSMVVLGINAILFGISWRTMPRSVFVKSAIGAFALTLFLELTASAGAFTDDVLLGATFGGVLAGIGIGIVVRYGASTGGSDFLAVILHSFLKNISVANLILLIDGVIIIAGGIAFGDYSLMLYATIAAFICTKVADTIVEGGNSAKSAYIISEKSEEISSLIMKTINRGVTGVYGKGMYTNRNITMLICIVKRGEIPRLRSVVKSVDNNAFIIFSEVREVLGEGF